LLKTGRKKNGPVPIVEEEVSLSGSELLSRAEIKGGGDLHELSGGKRGKTKSKKPQKKSKGCSL